MQLHFRTLWISDTHLGGRNLKSAQLYDFLQKTESEYLYLVGDILDLWKLKRSWYWPEINDRIIKLILDKARNGTRVFYLPGNHDAQIQQYMGAELSTITICGEAIHQSAGGDRFLVLHGHQFDCVVQHSRWLANVGSFLYDLLLVANRWYDRLPRSPRRSNFSLSASIKHRCKLAVNYIGNFEQVLTEAIRKNQVDGIICGHIHHASIRTLGRYLYSNSGDWVESCTALAENTSGTIGIIEWPGQSLLPETTRQANNAQDRYSNRCLAPTN